MKILLDKSENLLTLEKVCVVDSAKLSESFGGDLHKLFCEIKEFFSLSILHAIMLLNDTSLLESVSWSGMKSIDTDNKWKTAYFSDVKSNNIMNQILMRYLLQGEPLKKSPEKNTMTNKACESNIDKILMVLSSVDLDVFYTSM